VVKYLMKMGRPVPAELLKQIQEDRVHEIETDVYNKTNHMEDDDDCDNDPHIPNQPTLYQPYIQNRHISKMPIHPPPPPNKFSHPPNKFSQPPNKFSPQYASYIGAKPRAQASAKVRLGGVYH